MITLREQTIKKLEGNAPDLTEIVFSENEGGITHNLQFMARILTVNTVLESYSLSKFELGSGYPQHTMQEGIVEVAEALKKNTTLKSLNLNYHALSDNDLAAIADMLSVNATLTELNLNKCSVNGNGLKFLAQGLAKNKGLKRIYLQMNDIGTDISALEALTTAFQQNNTIIYLDLGRNRITGESAKFFKEVLQYNKALKTLNLSFNSLPDEGVIPLAEGLAINKTIKELNFHCNNIGPEGAKALANAISHHPSLTELDMGSNGIESIGAAALAVAIKNHPSLVSLGLSSCDIDDVGAQAITTALIQGNNVLSELKLHFNKLTENSIVAFVELINKNQRLSGLYIGGNHFGSKGTQQLYKALANNRSLGQFSLFDNHLKHVRRPKTIEAFSEVGNKNTTLIDFSFYDVKAPHETQAVKKAIKANQKKAFELIDAVYKGNFELVQQLLQDGVSPYFRCYSCDANYIRWIDSEETKTYSFRPDFSGKSGSSKKENKGETLLHMAIRQQHLEILELLLKEPKAKSLLNILNEEYKTPLELAQSLENPAFYQAIHATLPVVRTNAEKRPAPAEETPEIAQATLELAPPAYNTRAAKRRIG